MRKIKLDYDEVERLHRWYLVTYRRGLAKPEDGKILRKIEEYLDKIERKQKGKKHGN